MGANRNTFVVLISAATLFCAACDQTSIRNGSVCSNLPGTPGEIAATPRERNDLELVALKLFPDKLIIDDATYDRVLADVAAITAANSEIAKSEGPFLPPGSPGSYSNGRSFRLYVNAETYATIKAGTYNAWNCLNEHYQMTNMLVYENHVLVNFKGNYNLKPLAERYGHLPGVTRVDFLATGGYDGPRLCAGREGNLFQYAVIAAYNDCPAGCLYHALYCYETSAPGVLQQHAGQVDCAKWYAQFCAP